MADWPDSASISGELVLGETNRPSLMADDAMSMSFLTEVGAVRAAPTDRDYSAASE